MSSRTLAIVGGGHAGASALQTLRGNGWRENLVLVTQEGSPPYERPPLSKDVLLGNKTTSDIDIFPPDWLRKNDIRFLSGVRAERIAPKDNLLSLSDGTEIRYHRLLLATGSVPRQLDAAGARLEGVLSLRDASDADRLRRYLAPAARLVIIGGGLIGLEVAASATSRGCRVTVVEKSDQVLARVLPVELAKRVAEFHQSRGVEILLSQDVEAIEGQSRATAVRLRGGRTLPCDVVLMAIGAAPNFALAERAGLKVDNGVVVDEFLMTSEEDIYAAGDVARLRMSGGSSIRLENWKNAQEQGAAAALNMLGRAQRYCATPWMWSDQFERVIQMAGAPRDGQTFAQRSLGEVGAAVFMIGAQGDLQAAAAFGEVAAVARVIRPSLTLIERGLCPSPAQLENAAIDLKSIVNASKASRSRQERSNEPQTASAQ